MVCGVKVRTIYLNRLASRPAQLHHSNLNRVFCLFSVQLAFAELRAQLYYLFSPYGKVIDVVAQKGPKKRGQAFVVFRDLAGATSAMRSLDGELFYDKKMVRSLHTANLEKLLGDITMRSNINF